MTVRGCGLLVVSVGIAACQPSKTAMVSRPGSAALAQACTEIGADYRIPADPGGPPNDNQNSEASLASELGALDIKDRAAAAKKLLRHSERRAAPVLDAAIHVAGSLGDFRVLNNLGEIVTERGWTGDGSSEAEGRIAYRTRSRVAAAAAMGRILQQDRSAPPGQPSDETGDGISDEATADALEALVLSACIGNALELRAAAVEAIGLARNPSAVDFLELMFLDTGEPDDNADLVLRLVIGRALTNITHNNHLAETDVDERVAALLHAVEAAIAAEEAQ